MDASTQYADFLAEFKREARWLLWRNEVRQGRATKIPYTLTGRWATWNDASSWTTYEAARGKLSTDRSYDGLGFVIPEDSVLVDLDGCRNPQTGAIESWASDIVTLLDAPTEISPSGAGLHIYVKSQNARSVSHLFATGENKRGIEIFIQRYSTITFDHLPGTPYEIPQRDLTEFIASVERGDFDAEDFRDVRIHESCSRWEHDTERRDDRLGTSFDLDRWLAARKVEVLQRKSDGIILIACPGSHGGYDRRDGRAFVKQFSSGAVAMGCLHQSCSLANTNGNRWREFRRLVEGIKAGATPSRAQMADPLRHATMPPRFSEDDLALRFTQRHMRDLRYVARWGKWLRYDSGCWKEDCVLDVFDKCRVICREASDEYLIEGKRALAKKLTSASTIAAVHRIATSDQRTAATVNQWDSSIWLLNTPAGAVDPCTGEIRPALREDYFMKITAVAPCGECPLWLRFLDQITAGDVELRRFLQRMVGYALTGSTREECLFFLYGMGANGKSKFLGAVSGMLGEYAKTAPIETFISTSGERHPTDLAGLQGARLVTAIETEQDRRWAESKIKTLTGGDPISARFMRQDFFEYMPQFKLIIAGNHKPGLRSVNEAIRRRFHLVPFKVVIPEAERDLSLAEKLRAEWPGILKWAVDGCIAWCQGGLNPPPAVTDATAAYLANEDHVARWIEDCCRLGQRDAAKTQALYKSYCTWCEANNEKPLSSKEFSEELNRKEFVIEHTMYGNVRRGIGLRTEAHEGN